jgi:uncharacterized protein YkwD
VLFLLAGAWVLFIVLVLAVCRAAARADEQDDRAARRLARIRTVGLVTATTAAAAGVQAPASEAAACAARVHAAPSDIADALACRIDTRRDGLNLRSVHDDAALTRAARGYAQNMAANDFFAHVSPAGGRLRDRIVRAGWVTERCDWHVGEALAWGSGSHANAAWVVSAWMHSPEHRRILTGRDYDEIGVGVVRGAPMPTSSPAITAVALLGRHHCPD